MQLDGDARRVRGDDRELQRSADARVRHVLAEQVDGREPVAIDVPEPTNETKDRGMSMDGTMDFGADPEAALGATVEVPVLGGKVDGSRPATFRR